MSVKVTDNSGQAMSEFRSAMNRALETIGSTAEGYAKVALTEQHAVDTGRLRGSVSHAVDGYSVYIGTNVEYAPYIEFGTSKQKARPYLKPAATEYPKTYRAIVERELKGS
jgi:HK97 gp10 family phage protein